jgi:diguanylate cyclase (GGDEF)-like protein
MAGVREQRIGLTREGERARRLARVDALTGLGNRRAFDEALATEIARAERAGAPLSVLVADLDGFKAINDRWGHLAGDRCLKEVAGAIRAAVREPDSCFRWGGDEFAVLLPGTDTADAEQVSTRLAESVAEECTSPGGQPMTIAWGTALLGDGQTPEGLLAAADAALIAAKERGQPGADEDRAQPAAGRETAG